MNIFPEHRERGFHVCCRLYTIFFGLYLEIAAKPIEEFSILTVYFVLK